MFPIRLSIATLNLWNTERWPRRQSALQKFVDIFQPDILCVQEIRPETQAFLGRALPNYGCVNDEFAGWSCEGNIYWNREIFDRVEHGAEDIGLLEKYRRLFWVRLQVKDIRKTVFVSNVHLTYQEHPDELKTGISPRVQQMHNAIIHLRKLVGDQEPAFFTGDLNDTVHPILLLRKAGYSDCFTAKGLLCPSTFPSYPTAKYPVDSSEPTLSQTRDWIAANEHARPIISQVPHCYYDDMAPSDHWPVVAIGFGA